MINIDLGPDETVVLDNKEISRGGYPSSFSNELLLTNHSIVYIEKGFFGKVKDIQRFPLDKIKIFNGVAQAIASNPKGENGLALTVFFRGSTETFYFPSPAWRDLKDWVEEINELLIGVRCGFKPEDIGMKKPIGEQIASFIGAAKPVADGVGGQVSEAFNVVKSEVAGATGQISNIAETARPVAASAAKAAKPFAPLVAAAMLPNNHASDLIVDMIGNNVAGGRDLQEGGRPQSGSVSIDDSADVERNAGEADLMGSSDAPANDGNASIDQQIETLKKLKSLLDAGILTQEEFDAKKKEVMNL